MESNTKIEKSKKKMKKVKKEYTINKSGKCLDNSTKIDYNYVL
jgi:hypothetical protein